MTFDELKKYFNNASYRTIAEAIRVSPSQLTYYRKNGIPLGRQVIIAEQTGGKLKISFDKQPSKDNTNVS